MGAWVGMDWLSQGKPGQLVNLYTFTCTLISVFSKVELSLFTNSGGSNGRPGPIKVTLFQVNAKLKGLENQNLTHDKDLRVIWRCQCRDKTVLWCTIHRLHYICAESYTIWIITIFNECRSIDIKHCFDKVLEQNSYQAIIYTKDDSFSCHHDICHKRN